MGDRLSVFVKAMRAPTRRRRTRRRRASPGASLLVSALVHVLVLAGAGAVVWQTALPSLRAPAQAFVAFENPGGEHAARERGEGGRGGAGAPYRLDEVTSAGSLEPLLSSAAAGPPAGAMTGLSTAGPSRAEGPSAVGVLTGSGLAASGSLFAPAAGEGGAGAATAGTGEGSEGVTFAGLGASGARSVVYVVDCSGPMVSTLPLVIAELERSVARLSPSQRFGVVAFRRAGEDGPGFERFAPVLVRATPSARQLLHDWLAALEPGGRSSPLAGLEAGLEMRPDAVFLLSRSIQRSGGGVWEHGLKPTMARLEALNPAGPAGRRPVLIQTIQFIDEDPTGVMQAIGQRHGGGKGYRVIRRQQDLQARPAAGSADAGAGADER